MYNKALDIMDSILPSVLTNENLILQSLCLLIEAKCLMAKLSDGLLMGRTKDEKKGKENIINIFFSNINIIIFIEFFIFLFFFFFFFYDYF